MKYFIQLVLVIFLINPIANKAQNLDYIILNQEQGLTTTFIHCMYIDQRGIQWIGTGGHGLIRFDGKNYSKVEEDFGLDTYNISSIIEDDNHNLILHLSNYGFVVFDGNKVVHKIKESTYNELKNTYVKFYNLDGITYVVSPTCVFTINPSKNYEFKKVAKFDFDEQNKKFSFFLLNKKLFVVKNDTIFKIENNNIKKIKNHFYNSKINTVFQLNSTIIIAGLDTGNIIEIKEINEKLESKVLYKDLLDLDNNSFIPAKIHAFDNKNLIVVGEHDMGFILIENGKINRINASNTFPGINVREIVLDKEGSIYFPSIGKGIIKIPSTKFYNFRNIKEATYPLTFGILKYKDHLLLADNNKGLFDFIENENGTLKLVHKNLDKDLKIMKIIKSQSNKILLLGNKIYSYDFTTKKIESLETNISNKISNYRDLIQCKDGNYIAGYVGGIVIFDSNFKLLKTIENYDNKPIGIVTAVIQYKNDLIFGGNTGIYKFNLANNQLKKLNNLPINGITKDQNENLWMVNNNDLVTYTNGTFKYHSTYTSAYTKNNYTIAPVKNNQLLVGSNLGIQILTIDKNSKIIKSTPYAQNTGFHGLETNGNGFAYDNNQNLYFNTTNGLYKYVVEDFVNQEIVYSPFITNISLTDKASEFYKNVDAFDAWNKIPKPNYVFETNENNLKFSLYSNYTTNDINTYYSYKLIGNDKDWSLPTNSKEITYTNLKYGKYELLVKIVNENNIQIGETLSYKFSINTPLYFKWWFVLPLLSLFVLGLIYVYRNSRNYNEELSKNFYEISNNRTEIRYYFLFIGFYIPVMFLIDYYLVTKNPGPLLFKFSVGIICLAIYKLSTKKSYVKDNLRSLFFIFCIIYFLYSMGILFTRDLNSIHICQAILAIFLCQSIFRTYKDFIAFTILNLLIIIVLFISRPEYLIEIYSLFFSIVFMLLVNYARRISVLNTKENFVFAHNIINSSNAIIIAADHKNSIRFVGDSVTEITGYTPKELLNKNLKNYSELGNLNIQTNVPNDLNVVVSKFKCKDGEIKHIQWSVKNHTSKLNLFIGQDITKRILLEEQYKNIIQLANDIICETDIQGNISFANKYIQDVLGYKPEQVIGTNFKLYVPKNIHHSIIKNFNAILTNQENQDHVPTFECPLIKKNNEIVWVAQRIRIKRDINGNVVGFVTILRDITQEKLITEQEKDTNQYIKLLNTTITEISSLNFISFKNKDQLIKYIAETVLPILNVNRFSLWYKKNTKLELISLYDLTLKKSFKGNSIDLNNTPQYLSYLKQNLFFVSIKHPEISQEVDPHYGDLYQLKSYIDIPFYSKGVMDGIISFETNEIEKKWTPEEIVFCKNVVDVLLIGLSNIKRHEAEKLTIYKSEILTAIAKTTHILLSSKSVNEIFESTLHHIGKAANVDRVYFFSADNEKQTISQMYEWTGAGVTPVINMSELQNMNWSTLPGLIYMLRNNIPFIEIVSKIKDYNTRTTLEDQDIKSILILPIFVKNIFYGFIGFDDCKLPREWSIDEINILSTFASNIQSSIERILNEKATKESEEKFRLLANNIPAGVYMFDFGNAYRKVFLNNTIQTITGYNYHEFDQKFLNISDLYHPEDAINTRNIIKNAIRKRQPYYVTTRIINKEGKILWIEEYGEAVFEEQSLKLIQGVIIDITEKKLAEEAIRSKEIAEASSASKMKFLANMSHEIRTPLNGIIGFTDLLNKTKLNSIQNQYVEVINQSSKSLLEVVNDILDFSKIEAGKLEINVVETNLYELINQVIDMNKYSVHKKNINFIVNISDEIPEVIYIDHIRVKQILVNLLSNAVKFTSEGYIELGIIKLHDTIKDSLATLKFYVRDTGIGVKPENREKIFEVFTQEDNSTTRIYGGTGLGLPISNRLLKLMNSKIEVNDNLNATHGSEFSFTLNINYKANQNKLYKIPNTIKNILIIDTVNQNSIYFAEAINNLNIKTFIELQEERVYQYKDSVDMIIANFDVADPKIMPEVISWNIPIISAINSTTTTNHLKEYKNVIRKVKPLKTYELKQYIKEALDTKVNPYHINLENAFETVNDLLRIIIVEDNKVNMLLTTTLITKILPNAQIFKAYNGQEGIELHKKYKADFILMDIQMPIKNGYDATAEIRQYDNKTIIIALTAAIIKDDADKCFKAGMDDYISKPINRVELFNKLKFWIEKKRNASTN